MESEPPKPNETETGTVIEFYVPDRHKKATRFIPESLRGRLLVFPDPFLKKPA